MPPTPVTLSVPREEGAADRRRAIQIIGVKSEILVDRVRPV